MVSSGWQNRSMIAARRLCPTPSRRQRNADCINGTDKQVESFRKNVSARIGGLGKSDVAAVTSACDFDLRDIRRKPMTI
jgi:type IV secretory pathway TraG/TraD family ATPase VirD4